MEEFVSMQKVIALWDKYHPTIAVNAIEYDAELRKLPTVNQESIETQSSDLISRQVAIDIVAPYDDNRVMRDALEELPPAQPAPHWHPVSEQPQEDDDYLLLTHEKTKYGTFERIIIGAWNGATKEWLEEYEGMYRDVNHPIAWMSKEELLLLKGCEVAE